GHHHPGAPPHPGGVTSPPGPVSRRCVAPPRRASLISSDALATVRSRVGGPLWGLRPAPRHGAGAGLVRAGVSDRPWLGGAAGPGGGGGLAGAAPRGRGAPDRRY